MAHTERSSSPPPRGTCPECKADVPLIQHADGQGTLKAHPSAGFMGDDEPCPGTGKLEEFPDVEDDADPGAPVICINDQVFELPPCLICGFITRLDAITIRAVDGSVYTSHVLRCVDSVNPPSRTRGRPCAFYTTMTLTRPDLDEN